MKAFILPTLFSTLAFLSLGTGPGIAAESKESAKISETAGEILNHTVCKKGADSRELEIISKSPGHATTYARTGEAKEVATCASSPEKCVAVFDQIKTKLEHLGFTCQP